MGQLFDAGRDHFDVLTGPLWEPVGRATVEVARPVAGERVFDACCGAGASAIPAAQAVGPDGRVDAVDLSGRLLALGRSRGAGLPQLSFHQADVTTWTGGPYDVLQCALGIFFLPDMTAATRAMARQLGPGGRFVATVWHQNAMAPLPQLLAAALAPESPPGTSGSANRLNTAEALTGLFHSADLDEVHVTTVPMAVPLTPELAWSVVLGSAMRARLSALDDDAVERTRQRFQHSLGTDTLDATILVGSGVAGVAPCLRERQAQAGPARAWLAVTRASLADDNDDLMTSANEIRRIFTALCSPPPDEQHARRWTRWRHRHQPKSGLLRT